MSSKMRICAKVRSIAVAARYKAWDCGIAG